MKKASPVSIPSKELRRKHLTLDEWRRLLDEARNAGLREEALLLVVYEAGLRREEVGALRLSYLKHLREGKLYVWRGKGSVSGFVTLSRETCHVLAAYVKASRPPGTRRPDLPIFPGRDATSTRGITGRAVYDIFYKLASRAGVILHLRHPHVLKHSRVQHLLEEASRRGVDPWTMLHVVAELVGHATAQTTIRHYTSATSKERRVAEEITRDLTR